jgi:hypothetical protein
MNKPVPPPVKEIPMQYGSTAMEVRVPMMTVGLLVGVPSVDGASVAVHQVVKFTDKTVCSLFPFTPFFVLFSYVCSIPSVYSRTLTLMNSQNSSGTKCVYCFNLVTELLFVLSVASLWSNCFPLFQLLVKDMDSRTPIYACFPNGQSFTTVLHSAVFLKKTKNVDTLFLVLVCLSLSRSHCTASLLQIADVMYDANGSKERIPLKVTAGTHTFPSVVLVSIFSLCAALCFLF